MKVTTKFFMLALILSLMLTVSAVAAAEDISFDKSDTKNTNKNLLSTDDGKENLKTNCIPDGFENMTVENFDEFLKERRKLMANKIKEYYYSL